MRNRTVVVMVAEDDTALPATLAIGRSEELLLLSVDAEHLDGALELLVPDADALLHQLGVRDGASLAVLSRTHHPSGIPRIARAAIAIAPLDEYTVVNVELRGARFALVLQDAGAVATQVQAVRPASGVSFDEALRRLSRPPAD